MTEALQIWLQPLRDYAKRPIIVDDFRYHLRGDRGVDDLGDLFIDFNCKGGRTVALVGTTPPGIWMHEGIEITPGFMRTLVHEIGHTFGLDDTYVREDELELEQGGVNQTTGAQPASIMAGLAWSRDGGLLTEDDKNGIVWLYKVAYEGLGLRDCFFPDYEKEPRQTQRGAGCRPKHPLIFALKYDNEHSAVSILRDDENLDVKAQDTDGMTALHYAALNGYTHVVKAILARDDIDIVDVSNRNRVGHTVLSDAMEQGHEDIVKLLLQYHPLTVNPKQLLTTTWGALKTAK